jgi:hypothetical protein
MVTEKASAGLGPPKLFLYSNSHSNCQAMLTFAHRAPALTPRRKRKLHGFPELGTLTKGFFLTQ